MLSFRQSHDVLPILPTIIILCLKFKRECKGHNMSLRKKRVCTQSLLIVKLKYKPLVLIYGRAKELLHMQEALRKCTR